MLVPLMHLITVAQAMIFASEPGSDWNSIFQNTAGIVFLGTPHRGSSSASGPPFCFIRFFLRRKIPPLLRLLRAKSTSLVLMATQFNNIWESPGQFKGIRGSQSIFTFCETKAMFGAKMVIHHSTFLQHLSHQLLLSDCPQEGCDRKMSRRADI